MNRLQKKCFVASAGFHSLLALILLIGSGFLSSDNKQVLPVLDFVPTRLVDAAVFGGGNPNGRLPPPPAPLPQLPPQLQATPPAPAPPAPPEPRKEIVQPTKPSPDSLEVKTEPKARKPQINLQLVQRPRNAATKQVQSSDSAAKAEAKRIAAELGKAAANIRKNTSAGTEIEPIGPGGGGETYASYDAWVKNVYEQAWIEPNDVNDDKATAKVSVTILHDGTVLSATIIQSSGNASVDRSVEATLRRVKFIAPFPEGTKDLQRTFKINFNLKAKRSLG